MVPRLFAAELGDKASPAAVQRMASYVLAHATDTESLYRLINQQLAAATTDKGHRQ
jgi:hypothetical protein